MELRQLIRCAAVLFIFFTASAAQTRKHAVHPNPRPKPHTGNAAYINYDLLASPQETYGLFGYGRRIGSGVVQLGFLARAAGDDRTFTLIGAGWQRHSEHGGSTVTIGDAESYRGKYEESVRFTGVQYAARNLAYSLGFERADLPDSPMHFGSVMAQLTASRVLGKRLTAETHLFADSGATLLGLAAGWRTPAAGELHLGLAPERTKGLTGFFSYAYASRRVHVAIDDRVWGAQSYAPGIPAPANYRGAHATLEYNISRHGDAIRVTYATQTQGVFSVRTATAGYVARIDGADLHIDLASAGAAGMHRIGLDTYFSVPLDGRRVLTEATSSQGNALSSAVTLRQDLPESGVGTGYAVNMGQSGTAYADATVNLRSSASSTQLELSRFGGELSWNAEFSGALMFLDGRTLATNQTIDQSGAYDMLKGRSSIGITIVRRNGEPIPAGSTVSAIGEDGQWRVDSDGRVELDDITAGPQTLLVTLPSGVCTIGIVAPPATNIAYDLGKQICRRT
jgi:outer membrane usher protein FimD/PapC